MAAEAEVSDVQPAACDLSRMNGAASEQQAVRAFVPVF